MGDIGTFAKAFAGGLVGKLAGALFTAILLLLGFGPDELAKFIVTGLPNWITPVRAQAVFLILATLTFGALVWSFLTQRHSNMSQQLTAPIESTRRAWIAQARDFVSRTVRQNPDDIYFQNQLEHFPIRLNRRGFPNQHLSDSSCMLVLEASMHGQSPFERSSAACHWGN